MDTIYNLQHRLCSLVHLMGGSVRKDVVSSVTHVVANTVFGSKYKVCMNAVGAYWTVLFCYDRQLYVLIHLL